MIAAIMELALTVAFNLNLVIFFMTHDQCALKKLSIIDSLHMKMMNRFSPSRLLNEMHLKTLKM